MVAIIVKRHLQLVFLKFWHSFKQGVVQFDVQIIFFSQNEKVDQEGTNADTNAEGLIPRHITIWKDNSLGHAPWGCFAAGEGNRPFIWYLLLPWTVPTCQRQLPNCQSGTQWYCMIIMFNPVTNSGTWNFKWGAEWWVLAKEGTGEIFKISSDAFPMILIKLPTEKKDMTVQLTAICLIIFFFFKFQNAIMKHSELHTWIAEILNLQILPSYFSNTTYNYDSRVFSSSH